MEGCPMVDFIGHLETFDRDMLYILEHLDSEELWKGYERYGFHGHVGKDPNVYGTKYKKTHSADFTDEMKRTLYGQLYLDFIRLGYSMDLPLDAMEAAAISQHRDLRTHVFPPLPAQKPHQEHFHH
jgi:hypothetical protein